MLELSDWMRRQDLPKKPWLLIGQGPTFASRDQVDTSGYNLWGLDHVARELRVDVAQALDVETVASCADCLEKNCRWLIMPRRPEVNRKLGPPLESYFDRTPVLRRLAAQNRLVSYNPAGASLANPATGDPAKHTAARCGSVESAVEILVQLNLKRVRSLGIDGGHGYSPEFEDLEVGTLRSIGHEHSDVPLRDIEALFHARGIDYAPLAEPMRVFVGVDERLRVPARVLEFGIRKHASRPVVVDFLRHVKPARPKQLRHRLRSTVSFRRFAIPELCGYRGRALYLDATAQVFADVAALWEIPFGPQRVLCTYQATRPGPCKTEKRFHPGRQLNVMLLDCARLHWELGQIVSGLDEGRYKHAQLTKELCIVPPDEIADTLPGEWNCVESHEPAHSKLVQYAARSLHPWKSHDNPLGGIWMAGYREAVKAGAIPAREVTLGVAAGHLKQELLSAFEGDSAAEIAALRLDLPQRLKLLASHQSKKVLSHARRLAGDTVRRLRSKAQ